MSTRHLNTVEAVRREGAPVIYVVVPCYDEEQVLPLSAPVLAEKLRSMAEAGKISAESRVLFVNDGSDDATWQVISGLHEQDRIYTGISFSHNEGHQTAVYAGLMCALDRGCDAAISIDADLQDDPAAIEKMVDEYLAGSEIVFGVRDNRDTDTRFKRGSAEAYYRFMGHMDTEVVYNSADFRLMGSRALEALSQYREANLFLRGIVPTLGFATSKVFYKRGERLAGESKYPLRKMAGLAIDGVTSFSTKPLHWITVAGIVALAVALIMLVYAVASWAMGDAVAGWASIMVSIWLIGGLVMISLGIIGEYVGKIYLESKRRPRYLVEKELD